MKLEIGKGRSVGKSAEIDNNHFGVNYLMHKEDGNNNAPYERIVDDLNEGNSTSVRYPGGTIAENSLDLTNPHHFDDTKKTTTATRSKNGDETVTEEIEVVTTLEFLKQAAANNWSATFVLPSKRYVDANGNIDEIATKAEITDYVKKVLTEAKKLGVKVDGFELGNEWYVPTDEDELTASEYGKIASILAEATDEAITEANLNYDPYIALQGAEGWRRFDPEDSDAYRTKDSLNDIYSNLSDKAKDAINAIVEHAYVLKPGNYRNASINLMDKYGLFAANDYLKEKFSADKDEVLATIVTEWNVDLRDSNIEGFGGIKQIDPVISAFHMLIANGVDQANFWAAQESTWNSLAGDAGKELRKPVRDVLDLMSDNLIGTKALDMNNGADGYTQLDPATNFRVHGFSGDDKQVLYVSSRNEDVKSVEIDLKKIRDSRKSDDVEVIEVTTFEAVYPDLVKPTPPKDETDKEAQKKYESDLEAYIKQFAKFQTTDITTASYSYEEFQNLNPIQFSPYETVSIEIIYEKPNGETETGTSAADLMFGTSANDTLVGEGGDDRLYGRSGHDTLSGGAGADTLTGGAGADDLNGGSDRDTVSYAKAGAKVNLDLRSKGTSGDAKNDTFTSIEDVVGSDYDDYIYGTNARNTLNGGDGADRLRGHDGNDVLIGGAGADDLNGGSGRDTASYADAKAKVNLDLRSKGTSGEAKNDTFTSIEDVVGSKYDDYVYGTDAHNTLNGGDGADRLRGHNGNDVLIGGAGADDLNGGSGRDTASYADAMAKVNLDLRSKGTSGEAKNDTFTSIEDVVGSKYDDYVYGTDAHNTLNGGDGADRLRGHNGNDVLIGGAGADDLNGGSGRDTASYADAMAKVNLDLRSKGTSGEAKNDTFTSIEDVVGSKYDDYVYGTDAHNTLNGGDGADRLRGHNGNDVLIGGAGADDLNGGSGRDTASYAEAGAKVNLDLRSKGTSGEAKNDTFTSIEDVVGSKYDDYIYGNDTGNTLNGGDGADRLRGHNGNDVLIGGAGNDNLNGGSGADVFVFHSGHGADRITDFRNDVDTIQLSSALTAGNADVFDFATQSGSDVVFDFGSGNTLTVDDVTIAQLQNDVEFI